MTDGLLDLARLIADSLALALDPYPRAPGASLDSLETDGDGQGDGPARPAPFAALAALKRGSDDDR